MKTVLERRLAEFVDRKVEVRRFCEFLDCDERPVMVIWGDSGLGKSALIARMIHECAQRKIPKAEVFSGKQWPYDYLGIMRKIRDDIGVEFFKSFTDLVNYYTVPKYEFKINVDNLGPVSVGEKMKLENATVGDIGAVIIKDAMFLSPREDMHVPEAERVARLTQAFIADLGNALQSGLRAVFFDAIEHMSEETRGWVWERLIYAITEGRLPNLRIVLSGTHRPAPEPAVQSYVEEAALRPLELADIKEYLALKGIEEARRGDLADMLFVNTGGNLAQLTVQVERFLKLQRERAQSGG